MRSDAWAAQDMNYEQESSIKHLETTHIVEVPSSVDFIYIMRKDTAFVAENVAQIVALDHGFPVETVKTVIHQKYEEFTDNLGQALLTAFSPKGKVELHFFEAEPLEEAEFQKAGTLPIVSLDPLLSDDVISFCVSRGFYPGGVKDIGQIARPGSTFLEDQSVEIVNLVGKSEVCVIEDDIFSGGSVISALEHLKQAGITIAKLIPGFQIGKPTKLDAMGIQVDPVIIYKTADNTDIFAKVDLGDPRDYLLGASGLVIQLSDGSYGRAPYILPFVSTSARASVPKETETSFALAAWELNKQFFVEVQQALGVPILLKHMDTHFLAYMQMEHGVGPDTPMLDLVKWASKQVEIEDLHLPIKLVFLDVNGTLLHDDAVSGELDPSQLQCLQTVIAQLKQQGIAVGLCSDSPPTQLAAFAKKLGLPNAPIIAENGNIIAYNDRKVIVKALDGLDSLKETTSALAGAQGCTQIADVSAVEFGGGPPNFAKGEWAFGANRETSISVFGPPELIESLGEALGDIQGISVDSSPEYNFLGIHPGKYKENKGALLSQLVKLGHEVTMVGNSKSDWVSPASGVTCAFVADSRISEEIMAQAGYISPLPTIQGATDILQTLYL